VSTLAVVLVVLVALLHVWFLVLEMFLWTTPGGRHVFGTTEQFAQESKALAANQGLYNGFLVAGLAWGAFDDRSDVTLFFLGCVIVAGVFGAATVSRRILLVQALPGAVAFAAVLAAR
jgi:putative membrane protein